MTGGSSGGGSLPSWGRLQTAQSRLKAEWISGSCSAEEILAIKEAIKSLRADDHRPVLILRDCDGCPNKEGDLIKRTLLDERFLLATPWFHCVRLQHEVVGDEHPLHKLFEGSRPAHVVVSTWDAERIIALPRFAPKDIWQAMRTVLRKEYKKNPETAMKGLVKLLSNYDALDERERELRDQLKVKEERGKDRRVQQLVAELKELAEDREELFDKERELRDIQLKSPPEAEESES